MLKMCRQLRSFLTGKRQVSGEVKRFQVSGSAVRVVIQSEAKNLLKQVGRDWVSGVSVQETGIINLILRRPQADEESFVVTHDCNGKILIR
jgi:hypothetical protein